MKKLMISLGTAAWAMAALVNASALSVSGEQTREINTGQGETQGAQAAATVPERRINRFSTGSIAICLLEPGFTDDQPICPGKTFAKDPTVSNTGTRDAIVFLEVDVPIRRIRIVEGGRASEAQDRELFSFTPSANWVLVKAELCMEEDRALYMKHIYAYRRILPVGGVTDPLFTELTMVPYLEGELADGERLLVSIRADAVQSAGFSVQDPEGAWNAYCENKE